MEIPRNQCLLNELETLITASGRFSGSSSPGPATGGSEDWPSAEDCRRKTSEERRESRLHVGRGT